MQDLLSLGYKVNTSDIKRAERDLDGFSRSNKNASANVKELGGTSDKTSKQLSTLTTRVGSVAAAYSAFASLRAVTQIADEFTKFTAQIKLATRSQDEFNAAFGDVVKVARSSQSDLAGLGVLYARITNATREMGLAQKDLSNITETVALSLRVSGATAKESASAMLQLSQAFGSGVLRGEEFNAVNEAAPELMRILADAIGQPVGALREIASEGALTSEILAKAFNNEETLSKLREQAKEVRTIGSAYTALRNELVLYVGQLDDSYSASENLADAILGLSRNLDVVARAAIAFVGVFAANKILKISSDFAEYSAKLIQTARASQAAKDAAIAEATARLATNEATKLAILFSQQDMVSKLNSAKASIQAAQAQIKASQSIGAYGAALLSVNQAQSRVIASTKAHSAALAELALLGQQADRVNKQIAASTAALSAAQKIGVSTTSIMARALGFLGGPIGAITTVLSLGATAWAIWGGEADKNEEKAKDAVLNQGEKIKSELDKQVELIQKRNELLRLGLPETTTDDIFSQIEGVLEKIKEVQNSGTIGGAPIPGLQAQQEILRALGSEYANLVQLAEAENKQIKEKEKIIASSKLAKWMGDYATNAEKAAEEIAKAKKELGEFFTPELETRIRNKFLKTDKQAEKELEKIQKAQKKRLEELKKATEDYEKVKQSQVDTEISSTNAIKKQIEDVRKQTEAIGRTESQTRAAENANIDFAISVIEMRKAMAQMSGGNNKLIAEYEAQIQAMKDLKSAQNGLYDKQAAQKIVDANKAIAKAIENDLVDAFENAFLRGGDFASSLKRAIEAQFAKLVLRPIIQSVVGSGQAAISAAGGIGNLLGSAGNISSLFSAVSGGLVSGVGSAIASAGSTFGSAALGSFAAGVKGSTLAAGLAGPTTAGAAGALGLGSVFGSALPWLSGGLALAGLLGGTRLFGRGKVSASILDQGFLEEQQASLQERFMSTVGALGGTAANASFFFGGNTGRQGQNPNFHLGLDLNGQRRFTTLESREGATGENGTFLGSEIALNQENLSLFTTRAVVTALQQSNFARNINELFDSIDERTASMEELTQLFSDAESLKNFNDAMRQMNGPLRVLADSSLAATQSFLQAVGGLEGFQQRMAFFYKEFTSDAEQFSDMSSMLSSELRAVGAGLFSTREQFSAFFKTLGPDQFARISALLPQIDSYYDTIEQRQAESFKATLDSLERIRKAGLGIADYLRQLGITEETLSPQQRLQAASAEFNRLLSLSKLGDVTSLEKITGASDQLLDAARSFFGSNAEFKSIFDRVTNELNGLTQGQSGNVFTAQPIAFQRQDQTNQALVTEIQGLRSDIASGDSINIKVVTVDGKVIMEETLSAARERSRRGELVVYAAGVK